HRNDSVVPFYFEIKESKQWIRDFSRDFFFAFINQYIAFKTRKPEYIDDSTGDFDRTLKTVKKEKLDYLVDLIENFELKYKNEHMEGGLWDLAREAPRKVAAYHDERVVQMIDEFQFLNRYIFRDQACTNRMDDLAGSYLHTCEYKNAPLLVSGSWVGWLMDDLNKFLPARFVKRPLRNMPEDDALETVFKYSLLRKVPVTPETAFLIARLTEGNPFYIDGLFGSAYEGKDLSRPEGVRATLEYETLHPDGSVHVGWMEYIESAFPRINELHAKDIVLYLSVHRDRRVGRKELKEALGLEMSDHELEKKFRALCGADIIEADMGFYKGVQDNIFDKIFRLYYSEDVDAFVSKEVPGEYKALFEDLLGRYRKLMGEYSRQKGAAAEFAVCSRLSGREWQTGAFASAMRNLPADFEFVAFERVWSYHSPPLHEPEFQVDVFAEAEQENYSLIGEIKNRKAKFSIKEAARFREKAAALTEIEEVGKAVLFVFSTNGFFKNTLEYLKRHGIAWSDDPRWLQATFGNPRT
ncbi:MAG: hypothetical protein GY866_13800, partial [Proteobacteria bacterium]|nr:hypothetical protein [Pseudomonadota bacterium]